MFFWNSLAFSMSQQILAIWSLVPVSSKFSLYVYKFLVHVLLNPVLKDFEHYLAAAAKSLESCPTLCDPIDGSPPGSPIPGILQARTLEWVAVSFPNAWKWKVKVNSLGCVQLFATLWTAAYQAPLVHGVFLTRIPEWIAISFFRENISNKC